MSNKPKNTKMKTLECECGCEAKTKGGRYVPGHDARHKRDLIAAALGGSKRAENRLAKLGWTKFLTAKRAKRNGDETTSKETPPDDGRPATPRKRRTRKGGPAAPDASVSLQQAIAAGADGANESS